MANEPVTEESVLKRTSFSKHVLVIREEIKAEKMEMENVGDSFIESKM